MLCLNRRHSQERRLPDSFLRKFSKKSARKKSTKKYRNCFEKQLCCGFLVDSQPRFRIVLLGLAGNGLRGQNHQVDQGVATFKARECQSFIADCLLQRDTRPFSCRLLLGSPPMPATKRQGKADRRMCEGIGWHVCRGLARGSAAGREFAQCDSFQ